MVKAKLFGVVGMDVNNNYFFKIKEGNPKIVGCSVCKEEITGKPFYYCEDTKHVWCEDCRTEDWGFCNFRSDHIHYYIQYLFEPKHLNTN